MCAPVESWWTSLDWRDKRPRGRCSAHYAPDTYPEPCSLQSHDIAEAPPVRPAGDSPPSVLPAHPRISPAQYHTLSARHTLAPKSPPVSASSPPAPSLLASRHETPFEFPIRRDNPFGASARGCWPVLLPGPDFHRLHRLNRNAARSRGPGRRFEFIATVEAAGVEPASANESSRAATCVDHCRSRSGRPVINRIRSQPPLVSPPTRRHSRGTSPNYRRLQGPPRAGNPGDGLLKEEP